MNRAERVEIVVREMERVTPYMYEGLYGNFLHNFMDGEKSKWTRNLSKYLTNNNEDWADIGEEIASLLWERFEQRISC